MRELRLGSADFSALCKDILRAEGRLRFRATGNSMRPSIRDGDLLTVSSVSPSDLQPGDVVLYLQPDGRAVVHRFVRRCGTDLRISGDAVPGPGEMVAPGQVIGRIEACERDGRAVNVDQGIARFRALSLHRTWRVRTTMRWIASLPRKGASRVLAALQQTALYQRLAKVALGSRVTYRSAQDEDLAGMAALYAHGRLAQPPVPEKGARGTQCEGERAFVALFSGRVVAAVVFTRETVGDASGRWVVKTLLVRKRFRGAGVQEELMRFSTTAVAAESDTETAHPETLSCPSELPGKG